MSDNSEAYPDPTAFGLAMVAVVSLPIAMACLVDDSSIDLAKLLLVGGILILIASLAAFKVNSNFGFLVFGLVGFGVFCSGYLVMDLYVEITFVIMFLLAFIWSISAGVPKLLSCILITTALIFLFGGLFAQYPDQDIYKTLQGVSAIANFLLNVYLSFGLAQGKVPVI